MDPLDAKFVGPEGLQQLLAAADQFLLFGLKRAACEQVAANLLAGQQALPPPLSLVCRLLLLADAFSAQALRDCCLGLLADRFDELATASLQRASAAAAAAAAAAGDDCGKLQQQQQYGASEGAAITCSTCQPDGQDVDALEQLVVTVAPTDGRDLLDGSAVLGASHGRIEGSGMRGAGQGTLLQDLRDKYLTVGGGGGRFLLAASSGGGGDVALARAAAAAATGAQRDALGAHFDGLLYAVAAHVLGDSC